MKWTQSPPYSTWSYEANVANELTNQFHLKSVNKYMATVKQHTGFKHTLHRILDNPNQLYFSRIWKLRPLWPCLQKILGTLGADDDEKIFLIEMWK